MVGISNTALTEINQSSESLAAAENELASIAKQLVEHENQSSAVADLSASNADEVSLAIWILFQRPLSNQPQT